MLFFARLSTTVALLAVAAMVLFCVSGCASQVDRDKLAALQRDCAAGLAWACLNANAMVEANQSDTMDGAGKVALGVVEVAGIIVLVPIVWLLGGFADDNGSGDSTTINVDVHNHAAPEPHFHR